MTLDGDMEDTTTDPRDRPPVASQDAGVAVIIAAGGRGTRFGSTVPKQLLVVAGESLLTRSVSAFVNPARVGQVVVVVPADLVDEARLHLPAASGVTMRVVPGGVRRQDSVAAGLRAVAREADVVLVHDAARPFVPADVIERTIRAARDHGAAIAAVPARDTIKRARSAATGPLVVETIPREEIYLAQTPQGFRRDVLEAAVRLGESGVEATDEARLAELAGFEVRIVDGDVRSLKITTPDDLSLAEALSRIAAGRRGDRPEASERIMGTGGNVAPLRVGVGYDSHRFVEGRPLVLGGVTIPFDKGLAGHSDADAVAHAVTDAVLGAGALGDIGQMFPDTDARWKDANSIRMLEEAVIRVRAAGLYVVNVDVVVVAERPKLAPHRDRIRECLARALDVDMSAVSVKGKTNEGVDAVGRGEALVAHAVALLGPMA